MSARITEAMVQKAQWAYEREITKAVDDGLDDDGFSKVRAVAIRAALTAALSTEPGEAEKKRAPVDYYKVLKRFAEEDGSIREGRLTALSFALAAAPLPEDTHHGR